MAKDSEVLEVAARLIDTPAKWCTGQGSVQQALVQKDGSWTNEMAYCGEVAITRAMVELYGLAAWTSGMYPQTKAVEGRVLDAVRELHPLMGAKDALAYHSPLLRHYNDHATMDQPTMHAAFIKAMNIALEQGE